MVHFPALGSLTRMQCRQRLPVSPVRQTLGFQRCAAQGKSLSKTLFTSLILKCSSGRAAIRRSLRSCVKPAFLISIQPGTSSIVSKFISLSWRVLIVLLEPRDVVSVSAEVCSWRRTSRVWAFTLSVGAASMPRLFRSVFFTPHCQGCFWPRAATPSQSSPR